MTGNIYSQIVDREKFFTPIHNRPFVIGVYDNIIKKIETAFRAELDAEYKRKTVTEATIRGWKTMDEKTRKVQLQAIEAENKAKRAQVRINFNNLLGNMREEIERSIPELQELLEMEVKVGLDKYFFGNQSEQHLLESMAINYSTALRDFDVEALADKLILAIQQEDKGFLYWFDRYCSKKDQLNSIFNPWKFKTAEKQNPAVGRVRLRLHQFINLPDMLAQVFYEDRFGVNSVDQPPIGESPAEQLLSILLNIK